MLKRFTIRKTKQKLKEIPEGKARDSWKGRGQREPCHTKVIAKGVLSQAPGPWERPATSLFKGLDPVSAGWLTCLWAVAAIARLIKEADKLALDEKLFLTTRNFEMALQRGTPER